MSIKPLKQTGFTIVEMCLATAIFSTVLVVITAGIINFTKSYIKGVHQSQTQETARSIINDVTQSVQFSSGYQTGSDGNWKSICLGSVKYSAHIGYFPSDPGATHTLIRSPYNGTGSGGTVCPPDESVPAGGTELAGDKLHLKTFNIVPTGTGTNTYNIEVYLQYGDTSDLFTPDGHCNDSDGNQFCAAADLTTSVQRRLQ